jgi:hypothetical protein
VEAGARGYIAVAVEGRRARVHMWDEVGGGGGGGGGGGCGCGAAEVLDGMRAHDVGWGLGVWCGCVGRPRCSSGWVLMMGWAGLDLLRQSASSRPGRARK